MPDANQAVVGGFVEPRGMIRSVVGGVVTHEVLGHTVPIGVDSGTSPLKKGDIAYLAVVDTELVLFKAKRGAFKPRPTNDVLATGPLSDIAGATVERGKIAGVLQVNFADGSSWAFDVPRVHLAAAEAIVATLARS